MPPLKDLKGRRFGQFVVLERFLGPTRNPSTHWLCRCSCGRELPVRSANLINGNSKSCGHKETGAANPRWKGCGELGGRYWSDVKAGARRRGLEFNVTMEEAWHLFLTQERRCALSGRPLKIKINRQEDGTASLDRIDSSLGYVAENIQWTHKDINRIKMHLPQDEFVRICREVAAHSAREK